MNMIIQHVGWFRAYLDNWPKNCIDLVRYKTEPTGAKAETPAGPTLTPEKARDKVKAAFRRAASKF